MSHQIYLQQQPFYTPFSRTTQVSQYQKKHSPTHTYPDQPSFISFLHLLQSMASSLFNLHTWQSFCTTCLQVSLVYLLVWHPPLHIPYISSPNHCLLFTTNAHTISTCFAVVPKLSHPFLVSFSFSLSTLLGTHIFYLNITHQSDHSHIYQLKCHLIFFPYRPGLNSMQHATSHTTAVQSPS